MASSRSAAVRFDECCEFVSVRTVLCGVDGIQRAVVSLPCEIMKYFEDRMTYIAKKEEEILGMRSSISRKEKRTETKGTFFPTRIRVSTNRFQRGRLPERQACDSDGNDETRVTQAVITKVSDSALHTQDCASLASPHPAALQVLTQVYSALYI
jgi:hypothetical protein